MAVLKSNFSVTKSATTVEQCQAKFKKKGGVETPSLLFNNVL